MARLWKLENGLLTFDKEYLRGIPEFKAILERKIVTKGDSDGRKKLENWKLLYYVHIVADLFTYPNQGGYNEKETHKAAVKEAQLPEDFKPDSEIKEAIAKYKEIQLATLPTLSTISNTLKGLKLSDTIVKNIINNIEKQIEVYNKKMESGEEANLAEGILLVNSMLDQLGSANKVAISIPKTVDVLETLYERLKKESGGATVGRGGKRIGNRADPDAL